MARPVKLAASLASLAAAAVLIVVLLRGGGGGGGEGKEAYFASLLNLGGGGSGVVVEGGEEEEGGGGGGLVEMLEEEWEAMFGAGGGGEGEEEVPVQQPGGKKMEELCLCDEEDEIREEVEEEEEEEEGCQPVTKIAFAKTHKTGSSTVQNMLLRFGVKHDLTFGMPPNSWMFSVIDELHSEVVTKGPWQALGFDIFAFHCRWDYHEVKKIIPEAKFFTILREPMDTFESNYVYMGAQKARGADLNQFAEKFAAQGEKRAKKAYVGQNNLLWDLGMDVQDLDDMDKVERKVREVEEQFELVMIMERFDESLVLLADHFCWPLEEVLYIKQNERLAELKNNATEKTREIMRTWLRGDYMLYDHFSRVMDEKVSAYGEDRMRRDVDRLRGMIEEVTSACIVGMVESEQEKKTGLFSVYTFETNPELPWCFPYTRREIEYCEMIRKHQTHRVEGMRLKGLID